MPHNLPIDEVNLPVADADICITCFCCQEIFTEKAIRLQ